MSDTAVMVHPAGSPSPRRWWATVLLLLAGAAAFTGVVVARQGPPAGGDTVGLTAVTSALAAGDLHAAAANTSVPNPPGYALLAAPLVVAAPSLFGSGTWCTPTGRAATLRSARAFRGDPHFATDVDECGWPDRLPGGAVVPPLPPWYRSQGLVGVLGWLVLAGGCLALLGAAGVATLRRQAALVAFLVFLPAASSAIVQLFHPQDMVSLGLSMAGLAQVLRRRFLWAGALFGLAVLTKQFALLALVPSVAAAPDLRARGRMVGAAAVVFGAGILPFLWSAPSATLSNLSGFSAGGAVDGSTVLSLLGGTGHVASAVARDAPVLFALVVSAWAAHRYRHGLARAEALVALTLVCLASRLVFESVVFPYYLLAASVTYFLLDLVARRLPTLSLAWCAAAAFFVALHPGNRAVAAFGTLVLAVLAVAAGFVALAQSASPAVGSRRGAEAGVAAARPVA